MPAKKSVAGKFVIEFCKVENLADNIDVYLTWDKSKSKVVTTKNKAADFTNESFEKNITADKMKSILILPTPSKIKIYQKNSDAKAKDMLIGTIILDYTLFTGMKERLFNFQIAINAVGILYPMLSLKITCDWSIGDKFGNWKKVDPEEPIVPEKKKKKKEKKGEKEGEKKVKDDKEKKIDVDNNEVESSETTSSKSPSVENNPNSSDVEVKLLNKDDKKNSKKEKEPESSDDEDNTSKEEQAGKAKENANSDEESSSEYSSEESSEEEEDDDDEDDDTGDSDDDSSDDENDIENEDENNKIQVKEISVTSDEGEEDD